jgi:N-acetylglucosaminyl-diphospho-decaprenol L-rhamnosyltransferase
VTSASTLSVVSHGHGPLLANLLRDLAEQEGIAEHLVIVTLNLADEFFDASAHPGLRLLVIRNSSPRGFAANHNAAFRQSVGTWFAVLNPDLRLPDRVTLRQLFAAPAARSQVALRAPVVLNSAGRREDSVRTNLTPWSLLKRAAGFDRQPRQPERPIQRGEAFYWLAGMLLVIDRAAYRQVGGFDERYFLYCEDCDLCARLYVAGFVLEVDRTVQVIHDAQRDSHRSFGHLRWHLGSLAKYWLSKGFWSVCLLSLVDRAKGVGTGSRLR